MKNTIIRLFLTIPLLVGLLAGCYKKETVEPEPEFYFLADLDHNQFKAASLEATYIKNTNRIYINAGQWDDELQLEKIVRFNFALPTVNNHVSTNFDASFEWVVGGDALSNKFNRVPSSNTDALIISRVDTINNVIEGTLNVNLKRGSHWTTNEEFVFLKNGSFRMQLVVQK